MPELRVPLDVPLDARAAADLRGRLFHAHPGIVRVDILAGEILLHLREEVPGLAERVLSFARAMVHTDIPWHGRLLDRQDLPASAFREDPVPSLQAAGEAILLDRGRVAFGPVLTRLQQGLARRFASMGEALGCLPYAFPSLLTLADLRRTGHLESFPHAVSFVSHFREDLEVLTAYAARLRRGAPDAPAAGELAEAGCVLSPTVCYHAYRALEGAALPESGKALWAVGKCFRYEAGNLTGIDRLWDFTMLELIFLGGRSGVLAQREALLRETAAFARQAGYAFTLETANDPFFADGYAAKRLYQEIHELKFEMRLALPHRGDDLACASYNAHRDFFGTRFSLAAGGAPAHTACVGFGLERWVYATVCQFGPDPERWPGILRDLLR